MMKLLEKLRRRVLSVLSDEALSFWSSGLQLLGVIGTVAVAASLVGIYFVNNELTVRSDARTHAARQIADAAKHDAENAHERAEQIQKSLDETIAKQAPRLITQAQRESFIEAVAGVPKGEVIVWVSNPDAEVQAYASQIRDMVLAAGYKSGISIGMGLGPGPSPIGVLVLVRDAKMQPPFAGPVQKALQLIGIDADGAIDSTVSPESIKIFVGRKF